MSNLDETQCPLCKTKCSWDHGVYMNNPFCPKVACPRCGGYIVNKQNVSDFISKRGQDAVRLAVLLFERSFSRHPSLPLFLIFAADGPPRPCLNSQAEPYADPVRVDDLLRQWPKYGHEQLDRALLLLSNLAPTAGRWFGLWPYLTEPANWFAEDDDQRCYLQAGLKDLKWIEIGARNCGSVEDSMRLTPAGWNRVEELTQTQSARVNPAFVAMWFGKPDKVAEMTRRYETAIHPAIEAAGYRAHRSDRDEHNEGIMDKIRFDIRRAPFVVADFTKHNRGVYYEAGLAMGQGIELIHCCPDDEFDEKHFDIAHRNLIKYNSDNDLLVRLERRILGSIGAGPFRDDQANK